MENDPLLSDPLLSPQDFSKLRWRCRRGLLENDLFIERYFNQFAGRLTHGQARGLYALMDLADNDLLDLFLARKEPDGDLSTPEVQGVLQQMRRSAPRLEANP